MNKATIITLLAGMLTAAHAATPLSVEVSNPSKFARECVPVVIDLSSQPDLLSALISQPDGGLTVRDAQSAAMPCQLDDLNQDGTPDELCFLTSLAARETKVFTIEVAEQREAEAKPSVYVEMLLANKKIKEQNRQDLYISSLTVDHGVNPYNQLHHHGAAFENELVAYRIYFDHRQTVDIYGKRHKGLELRETQFYPDEAQKQAGSGDDILWVGNTFGLGTLRGYNGEQPTMLSDVLHRTQRILSRGPLRTIVEVTDEGWKPEGEQHRLTLTTRYTLYAHRRDCQVDVYLSNGSSALGQTAPRFATGIINIKNSLEYSDHRGLRGCWGTDWPVSAKDSVGHQRETVGLGICLPQQCIVSEWEAPKDGEGHSAVENYGYEIRLQGSHLRYFITFGSDNEDFGHHSAEAWFNYLRQWKRELSVQPRVMVKQKE